MKTYIQVTLYGLKGLYLGIGTYIHTLVKRRAPSIGGHIEVSEGKKGKGEI